MSFKIFTQQLLGRIKPVQVIERKRKQLEQDYAEFRTVSESDELKRYQELEKIVNSEAFARRKAEIEGLRFKGSKEYNQLKELNRLKRSSAMKKYFKVAGSEQLRRYETFKNSEKLAEYDRLVEYVKEGQFEQEKKELRQQVFKGSVEEKHRNDWKRLDKSRGIRAYKKLHNSPRLKEMEAFANSEKLASLLRLRNQPEKDRAAKQALRELEKSPEVRAYFKFERSKELKYYREIAGSHELKRYQELQAYVESDEYKKRVSYLIDRTKYANSDAHKKYARYKQLAADSAIRFFLKFEKSGLYKNYLNVAGSFDLKRLNELEAIVASAEYKEKKAFLEDRNKWQKSPEYRQQQELQEMKKLPHLMRYFKYAGSTAFRFFENWEPVFHDDFTAPEINREKWSSRSFWGHSMLNDNYSLAGDLQTYTNGENLKTGAGLSIEVRKERATAKVWQRETGFMPLELDYTSAQLSTWNSFRMQDGMVEAKIKFNPVKETVSSFYLAGQTDTPRVNLLEMGFKNRVGIATLNKGKLEVEGLNISPLKRGWYIFTLKKEANSFRWQINETDIFSMQSSVGNQELHIGASTLVLNQMPAEKLPCSYEVAWVKCYRRRH